MNNPNLSSGADVTSRQPMPPRLARVEISSMNSHTTYAWAVSADRLARLRAEADHEQFARSVPSAPRRIRRTIGRSLVRTGQRLTAEAAVQDRPV